MINLLVWLLIFLCPVIPAQGQTPDGKKSDLGAINESFVIAKVTAVTDPAVNESLLKNAGIESKRQFVQVEITEGALKGMKVTVPNEITDNPAYNVNAMTGKEVVLCVVNEAGKPAEFSIADHHRAPVLYWLLAIFLAAFLIFGGKQGLKSLLGLAVGIVLIAVVLLPLSARGFNPLITAACISLVVTATTTTLVAGWSRKALAATLGTIGGVIIAGVASAIVVEIAPLTGLSNEEAQILRGSMMSQPLQFFSGLLAAGMLIGALGVIMDVAVSIASATAEVIDTDPTLTVHQLYRKGMNVGRDIMGTMTNTLILAYTGAALPLLLLMAAIPSTKLLNLDLVATEVASALTGSLGLVCTIPLTALAAARLMAGHGSCSTIDRRSKEVETQHDLLHALQTTGSAPSREN